MRYFIVVLSLCIIMSAPKSVSAENLTGGTYELSGTHVNGIEGTLQGGSYVLQGDIMTVSGELSGSPYAINTGYVAPPSPTTTVVSSGGGGGGGAGGTHISACPIRFNPEVVLDSSQGVEVSVLVPTSHEVVFGDKVYAQNTTFRLYPSQTTTYSVLVRGFGAQVGCTATVQVLGEIKETNIANTACKPFTKRLKIGNAGAEVRRMQVFLKSQGYKVDRLPLFGLKTEKAVIQFQKKYLKDIVFASGSKSPTGLWYEFTMKKANSITGCIGEVEKNKQPPQKKITTPSKVKTKAPLLQALPETTEEFVSCKPFETNLQIGSIGAEVRRMQKFLVSQGYDIEALGIFGPKTKTAVEKFQSLHAQEIIAPTLSTEPTGLWYEYTRKKANQIMGCK